jgi:MoaA/NifB/PqqE/SkfB family radical SAM enzyme
MTGGGIEYLEGWHGEEREERGPFRWMTRDAACLLKGVGGDGPRYLIFTAGHPFAGPELPRLEIWEAGRLIGSKSVATSFKTYYFPLEGTGDIRLEFKLDRDHQIPGDGRRLGLMVRPLEIASPVELDEPLFDDEWPSPEAGAGPPGRWLAERGRLILPRPGSGSPRFLALEISSEYHDLSQELAVSYDGRFLGRFGLVFGRHEYSLSLAGAPRVATIAAPSPGAETVPSSGPGELVLSLNKLVPAGLHPGDPRPMGALFGTAAFHDDATRHEAFLRFHGPTLEEARSWAPATAAEAAVEYLEGWRLEERDHEGPFRWMAKEAEVLVKGGWGPRYLVVRAGHPRLGEDPPRLEILAGERAVGTLLVDGSFGPVVLLWPEEGDAWARLRLDRVGGVAGDGRPLGVMVRRLQVVSPRELEAPLFGQGWHAEDRDDFLPFRWLGREARALLPIDPAAPPKRLVIPIFSEFHDFGQELTVSLGGQFLARLALLNRWNFYSIALAGAPDVRTLGEGASAPDSFPASGPGELVLSLNMLFPARYHPGDPRSLGVRVGPLAFDDDVEGLESFRFFHANAILNFREMTSGVQALSSFPTNLGIDLYGRCNIKPPCVYCLWDKMKDLEGECVDVSVDRETLESYGPFFRSARTLVNCSFGEPLLHPQFGSVLDFCARHGKIMEISTNGQAFTERTIQAVVGKPVILYISLDAATRETYAKLRNDHWDEIVPNLVRLNEARQKAGGLPKVYMVFIPMPVNLGDLEEYFRLCKRIAADALVLRPLLHLWNPKIERDRGGYHFDYAREMLTREQAEEVIRKCEALSVRYGVPLANQFNFGIVQDPGGKTLEGGRG